MARRAMVAAVFLAGGIAGCANAPTPAAVAYQNGIREAQAMEAERARWGEVGTPPPLPKTTYDVRAAAAEPSILAAGESPCDGAAKWQRRSDELGSDFRSRAWEYNYRSHEGRSSLEEAQRLGDHGTIVAMREREAKATVYARAWAAFQSSRNHAKYPETVDNMSVADIRASVDAAKCVVEVLRDDREELNTRTLEVLARKESDARCDGLPKCVEDRRLARIEDARVRACMGHAQMASAEAEAKTEWRTARKVGMVSVQNLRDQRDLYGFGEDDAKSASAEWESLTGRSFNKRICR